MWVLFYFIVLGYEPFAWKQPIEFSTETECADFVEENAELQNYVDYIQAMCVYQENLGKGV